MIAVTTAHEQSALDEFELLRMHVPEQLRIVVDTLADEHVQLLRLCNCARQRRTDDEEEMRE